MRRARIKATAVIPVRRKLQQAAAAPAEPPKDTSAPKPQESLENNVQPIKTTSTPVEQKIEAKTDAPNNLGEVSLPPVKEKEPVVKETPVKLNESIEKVVTSPVKQNESTEIQLFDVNSDSEVRTHVQSVRSLESPTRAKTPSESVKRPEVTTRTEKSPAPSVEGSPVKSIQSHRSHFTRPTPRLDGGGRVRRNSIQGSGASASESEDDSRRSISAVPSRVRNDSVCSVQSLKDSSNTNSVAAKLNVGQKRRMVVSESARKLAEARREFNLKHENKTPAHDKSSLTMYDLIYYNPVTNPMKPKPASQRPAVRKLSVNSVVENDKKEEEIADDTSGMPVPQVKVGPNGELIIDEQSLVIDQYKVQENIDRTNIIVDDDNTGNGFYKKRQKSKDWNKWETVIFYKALSTYGTDFLLMQSTFPNRTRTELKLKYKKEERINPNLVEKALRYQEFNTEALKEDLANVEENQRKESELKKKAKKDNSTVKKKRRRCKIVTDEVTGDLQNENSGNVSDDNQSSEEDVRITITAKKVRKRRRRKTKSSEIISDKSDKDDSESNSEMYNAKPTRSGRAPKRPRRATKPIKVYDVQEKKKRGRPKKIKLIPNDNKEKENENTLIDKENANTLIDKEDTNTLIEKEDENVLMEVIETGDNQPNESISSKEKVIPDDNKEKEDENTMINKEDTNTLIEKEDANVLMEVIETEDKQPNESSGSKEKVIPDDNKEKEDENTLLDIENTNTLIEKEDANSLIEKEDANALMEVVETEDKQPNESSSSNTVKNTETESSSKTIESKEIESSSKIVENNKSESNLNIAEVKKTDNCSNNIENNETISEDKVKNEVIPEIKNEVNTNASDVELKNLKPGSLVVLKKDSEDNPGTTTLQVYIVSDDYDASNPNYKDSLLPLDMPPEELQTVTNFIESMPPHNTS